MRISDWSSDVFSSDLQRPEDAGTQELFVRHPARSLDHLLGDAKQDVVVGVALSETAADRHVAQALGDLARGVGGGRPEQQVTGAQSEAAAVRQQVADAHLAGDVGIGHAEPRQVVDDRSEEHTSELQSLMRISYAVFCLKKKK